MPTQIIRLELSEKLWLNPTLHEPNKRKMGLPCFEWWQLLNDMKVPWYSLFSFLFFVYKQRYQKTIGWERLLSLLWHFFSKVSFRKYLITAMFKVLSRQLRSTLITALRTWINTGVEPAIRNLTYYCMLLFLSNKPSF